jgi:hypothetical protein
VVKRGRHVNHSGRAIARANLMRAGFHGPKRLFAGCAFTLWLFFTLTHAQTSESTASLRGVVTNASGGGGLRKAYLRLSPPIGSKGGASLTAVTNDQGAFAIENIAPGEYRLDVECTGFLDTQYGGGSPFDGRSVLKLSSGDKLTGIEIKMTPQAVLSGRVLAQDGDPWPHANIQVLRVVWKKGKRSLEGINYSSFSDVDDRGEFRMAGLPPGRYYVLAEPDKYWEQGHRAPATRQQPTWYPSSRDVESSTPVVLAAGQESPEIEIRLRSSGASPANFRVRGKVSGMQEIPPPGGDPRLVQRRIATSRISDGPDVQQNLSSRLSPDGSFEIAGVSSGSYDIWITQGYPALPLGHARVEIDNRDVDGVSIQLYATQTLHATLRIEGGEGIESPGDLIYLEPIGFFGYFGELPPAVEGGSLEFQEVGVGRYQVKLQDSVRARFYLKSVRYGNAESSDGSFTLVPDGGPLEVMLSALGARVTGVVLRAETATTPRVLLIPDTDDAARRENLSRSAVFDQNGMFTIKAIAPGSYKLYGFESVPDDIWLVPDFLKEVENFGVGLKAADGGLTTIQLPLVGKAATDRILAKLGLQN